MSIALPLSQVPVIAGGLGSLAGGIAELTGSQVAGNIGAGAVLGLASSYVEQKALDAYNAIYGAEATQRLSQNVSDLSALASTYSSFDPTRQDASQFVQEFERKKQENRQKAKDLAKMAIDIANESATIEKDPIDFTSQDQQSILEKLIVRNPVYSYLIDTVLEKTSNLVIPDNEEYAKISAIYNGQNLGTATETQAGQFKEFSITDEAGQRQVWNTTYNNFPVVPPIYGVWCGINSPNNSLPRDGSYLDTICMMHDISYHDRGSFNKLGDYQLISRAVNGKDKMILPGEREASNLAINYFSTLGNVMRKFMGPKDEDLSVSIGSGESSDVITSLGIENVKEFQNMFVEEVVELQKTDSVLSTSSNAYLVNLIDNLQIEID